VKRETEKIAAAHNKELWIHGSYQKKMKKVLVWKSFGRKEVNVNFVSKFSSERNH
jgi:hypothetical protein